MRVDGGLTWQAELPHQHGGNRCSLSPTRPLSRPPPARIILFASLELSKSKWVVTINSPGSEKFSKQVVEGGDDPVADCVGIGQRVFGQHEAIRSCGEVNGLIGRLFG